MLQLSRILFPAAAKAINISAALVVYTSTCGAQASEQAQLLGLLQFLQQAIQSSNWGLVSFYCNQILHILNRLDVDPVAVSSISGPLGN